MPGLLPEYHPKFSRGELAEALKVSRKRAAPYAMVQRAKLALLLTRKPTMTNPEAGRCLGLHENTVYKWRKRWATDGFSLRDLPHPGRPRVFSPRTSGIHQGRRM